MPIDRLINLVVTIMLIELMITIGLGVTVYELLGVVRDWRLVIKSLLANYIGVPAVTVGLLLLFPMHPLAATGLLVLAVCPGGPYGPPFALLAKGNFPISLGLMVILAGSSPLIAPPLLQFLLPLVAGQAAPEINTRKIVVALVVTQLFPLCIGLAVRYCFPALARSLHRPAIFLGKILNLVGSGMILVTQFPLMMKIAPSGYAGMLFLLLASLGIGWLLGGPEPRTRRALALITSLRNVAVGLVIVTGNFAGTPAVTAAVAYSILEVTGSLILAIWWSKRPTESAPATAG